MKGPAWTIAVFSKQADLCSDSPHFLSAPQRFSAGHCFELVLLWLQVLIGFSSSVGKIQSSQPALPQSNVSLFPAALRIPSQMLCVPLCLESLLVRPPSPSRSSFTVKPHPLSLFPSIQRLLSSAHMCSGLWSSVSCT